MPVEATGPQAPPTDLTLPLAESSSNVIGSGGAEAYEQQVTSELFGFDVTASDSIASGEEGDDV